jgi:pSer/pThr/pTyr-binding forkhead associated (FHA) protein
MIIGRSRTCDVIIPSAKVSRQHASLTRMGEDYYIEDLGSANGVWIRGEKITRVKVSNGDQFTISDETLTFDQR